MPLVHTQDLKPHQLEAEVQHQVYCGLDTCLTLEVFDAMRASWQVPKIYDFERALQGPYLEIMQRGFAVDALARANATKSLNERIFQIKQVLNEFADASWGKPLNPNSPAQLKDFFYKAMRFPEIWINQKGERKLSTNRESLEKLEQYLYARPFVSCILAIRDLEKQLEVFEANMDADWRFRSAYNIAGTETGRPSSSKNAFGTGRNAQNIAPGLRHVFVADRGKKLCVIDLEQVEARDVGFICGVLFNDWSYLDACESGDLHTNNAKLVWPELKWTGNPKSDRAVADQNFYREFSYRDMSKRGGHLSNYFGTAWTMARSLKIPLKLAEDFQTRYCKGPSCAYPAIAKYWQWVATELQTNYKLVNLFGRERHFFGRPGDDTTLREGIAFIPQGTTAERMNLGLWRVWKYMPQVQLLAQTYDAITFQFDDDPKVEALVVPEALERIRVELVAPNGRKYVVPGEAKTGWNWGYAHDPSKPPGRGNKYNPDGLQKWKASSPDTRKRVNSGFGSRI